MLHRPGSAKAQSGILLASFGKVNVDNEEEKKQGEGKGFAGLSSMVSDVDDVVSRVPKESQKARSEPPPKVVSSRNNRQPNQPWRLIRHLHNHRVAHPLASGCWELLWLLASSGLLTNQKTTDHRSLRIPQELRQLPQRQPANR